MAGGLPAGIGGGFEPAVESRLPRADFFQSAVTGTASGSQIARRDQILGLAGGRTLSGFLGLGRGIRLFPEAFTYQRRGQSLGTAPEPGAGKGETVHCQSATGLAGTPPLGLPYSQ